MSATTSQFDVYLEEDEREYIAFLCISNNPTRYLYDLNFGLKATNLMFRQLLDF